VPKHVVVPYVQNTLYSTNKYGCVRRVSTFYISYWVVMFYVDDLSNLAKPGTSFGKSGACEIKILQSVYFQTLLCLFVLHPGTFPLVTQLATLPANCRLFRHFNRKRIIPTFDKSGKKKKSFPHFVDCQNKICNIFTFYIFISIRIYNF